MERVRVLVWQEELWHVAQCVAFDIASQGANEQEAISNLKEALELARQEPVSTLLYADNFTVRPKKTAKLTELDL